MNVEIYYFSGTGNSLAVAKDIASGIKAKLIPVSSVVQKDKIIIGDVVGIVFPC